MAMRDEDFRAIPTLAGEDDGLRSLPMAAPVFEPPDWQLLCEQARARADAAEARAEELLVAERTARSLAGSLKWHLDKSRDKFEAAVEEAKEFRRTAKDALFYRSEVARLEKLLSEAGVDSRKRSTIVKLRREVGSLTRENARLSKALERARERKDELVSLRKANARQGKKIEALQARNARLEARVARLRSTRSALSKALFGTRSEKQKNEGTGRKRGQQRGTPGHGRTQRPGLDAGTIRPKDARICSCCGKPYVANARSTPHRDRGRGPPRIQRTRWRRRLRVLAPGK